MLSWAAFFLNADGTVYGRYGTRSAGDGADHAVSLAGFKKALEGALALHAGYPANKQALAGKTGPAPRWATPEAIPGMKEKHREEDLSRMGCIHCHMIADESLAEVRREGGKPDDRDLWGYPAPDCVGLALDIREAALVSAVAPGSAAERAGIEPGDRIAGMGGQPILSIADVQWVLHGSGDPARVPVEVERGGRRIGLNLPLERGWRRRGSFAWRAFAWDIRFKVLGFSAVPAGAAKRAQHGVEEGSLALEVHELAPAWLPGHNPAASRAGLEKGDLIVAVDGRTEAMDESRFLARVLQEKKAGEALDLKVLREGGPERLITFRLQ